MTNHPRPCPMGGRANVGPHLDTPPEERLRRAVMAELPDLLDRAEEFVKLSGNGGNCGPHHLVSDLASSLRALAQSRPHRGGAE